MNWGKSIVLAFVLFALFIASLVTVCVRQDISLVSTDYYKEELAYGEQIRRMENTNRLGALPAISVHGDSLVVDYVDFSRIASGTVTLFRPSNAAHDRTFTIMDERGRKAFDVSTMPAGMYKVRMLWTMNEQEYFVEEVINL